MCRAFRNSIKNAEARGIAMGEARGIAMGEGKMGRLMAFLLGKGLTDDALRASTDAEERQRLFTQYGIE